MKNKPVSHKLANRFQFKSFNEQLASIEIKYGRYELKNRHLYENSEESNFFKSLHKWEDLNCTQDFFNLKCRIGPFLNVTTLAQVVHEKERLVKTLKYCLDPSNKALEVALDLIVALAFDLRSEFYPYFMDIFDCLINLLNIQDSSILENVFMCFAYMFKSLWRYILNDFHTILIRFSHKLLSEDRKEYIKNFAAQSFSFLMRKVDDKEALLELIFGYLEKHEQLCEGIGVLLFETVRGVHQQLHSSSSKFLSILLLKFSSERWINSENIFEAIKCCFTSISKYVNKESSQTVWLSICDVLQQSVKTDSIGKLCAIFKLMISYKNCSLIFSPEVIISNLLKVIHLVKEHDEYIKTWFDCLTLLIRESHSSISLKVMSNLMKTIFSSDLRSLDIDYFLRSVIPYVFFERDVLPHFLPYFSAEIESSTSNDYFPFLTMLVEIIVNKCGRPLLGCDLTSTVYALYFPRLKHRDHHLSDLLLDVIKSSDNLQLVWSALICLPHIKPITNETCCEIITSRLKSSIRDLKNENGQYTSILELIILESVTSLFLLESTIVFEQVPCNEFISLLRCRMSDPIILQAFDFYLESAKRLHRTDVFELLLFESFFGELKTNLSSPSRSIRLLSLHICVLFSPTLPATESSDVINESVFKICLDAEMVPLSVEDFREKFRLLQKLERGSDSCGIPIEAISGYSYELTPVYFLCGTLYSNLSLLWPPINKIIAEYARSLKNADDFWRMILQHYCQTSDFISNDKRVNIHFEEPFSENIFNMFYDVAYRCKEDRPDHYNHRLQLLKIMHLLSDIVEKRNRDFVNLFFNFLENETSVINIKRDTVTEDISSESNDADDEEVKESCRKMIWKTLISFLEVFSSFRNPRALYKEREVHLVYNSLLQNKDFALQKATFNCILSYDFAFLIPYKENFLRLIDNKTFKSEIVNFTLNPSNEDDNVIRDDHRSELMPYLMRILYGKMLSKTGSNTSGHSKSTLRRSIVFRFLAGCPENELLFFFSLAFSAFSHIFDTELSSIVDEHKDINIQKCIPMRKVLSSLKTLEVMLFSLGNITKSLLPLFFKIIISIASYATSLLYRRSVIRDSAVAKLKIIRGECLKISAKFFEVFDEYNFSSVEIEAFFNCVVWPLLPKLSNESLSSPSPLLKLLVVWSENPRYFVLLMKTLESHIYPLSVVMDLYTDAKCTQSVIDFITTMLVNLLTFEDFECMQTEAGELVNPIEIPELNNSHGLRNDFEISYGKFILTPFTEKIITRLKLNFDERRKSKKNKKILMTSNELTVLTNISPFVKDESQCKTLARLLVETFSEKQRRSPEADCQTLETICSLLKATQTVDDGFLRSFVPLFRFICERNSRLELCNIISVITKNSSIFSLLGESISMINSYNPLSPEEPDYALRMEGFKIIKQSLDSIVTFQCEYILALLVYNCCFFISFVEDLGVREVSSSLLQFIVQTVNKPDLSTLFGKVCIDLLLLKEIRIGLRSKNDYVRDEFIVLLSHLARNCSDKSPLLKQLNLLCNEDDELDFYITIRHIQLHRRSRTLIRFVKSGDILEKLSSKVMSSYILPIVSGFLFDSRCRKNSGLIDSSIEALGIICRYIEWPVYKRLLSHYLNLLVKDFENHKMIVKILTTILNNFTYDLSLAVELEAVSETTNQSKAVAVKKIYDYLVNELLPNLHKHLHTFSRSDYEYDSMRDEYPEDNEIQRVPLAFAIVKLLKALPQKSNLLESNVPSVFLRLLHFLKSKSERIRETARTSLINVMQALGPQYFPYLLREMQSMLRKGYQVHVLTYTLHSIIVGLQSQLKSGDFDLCLEMIVDICIQEIFSDFADEKEVSKITAKVKEARKSKSFDTFYCISCFVSEQFLSKVISPLKNVLLESHNHKVMKKVSRCLQKVIFGLTDNSSLTENSLLTFFYGIVHGLIPELQFSTKKVNASKSVVSDYLLVSKPANKVKKTKPRIKSNEFILVQESLHILHILLKKDRLKPTNNDHIALLEPFISVLSNFITSNHPKLTSMSLKCLNLIILRFPTLKSFEIYANTIKNNLFVLMHKHTGIGMQQGENYELVIMLFKSMHYLISEIECVDLDEKQLEVLLVFAEKDIYENSRQAVAFSLLKAIISRRLQSPALKEIMNKLAEMLVQSEQDFVRKQCVHIWMRYLIDFPHGKNLKNHLMFFIRQLDYEHESGRQAILELLMSIVSRFPDVTLHLYTELLFIPIASRLINEESKTTRKLAAAVITKLFQRLDFSKRSSLLENIILSWFQNNAVLQQQLASRLCLLMCNVEQEQFTKRLHLIVPLLRKNVESFAALDTVSVVSTKEDHLAYQLLLLFLRIIKLKGDIVKSGEFLEEMFAILSVVNDTYLLYPHFWVRVVSVQIFEVVFSIYSVDEVIYSIQEPSNNNEYILNDTPTLLWNLCSKFLDLLRNVDDSNVFGESLIKNMLFVGKIFIRIPQQSELSETLNFNRMNIKWLITRMLREVRREVYENEMCTTKRTLIFKWIAAIVLELQREQLFSSLEILLSALCREVARRKDENQRTSDSLSILAEEVLKVIRGAVSNEVFNNTYAKVISLQNRRRMNRKNQRIIELITNPLKGLKRKHKKHVAYRESKKRKIAEKQGKKVKKIRVS